MQPVTVRNLTIGEGIPKICVPIVGNTKEQILKEAEEIPGLPVDLAEWRGERGTDRATENIRRDPSVVYLSHFA